MALLVLLFATSGCATNRYRPLGSGGPPGYKSRLVGIDVWEVWFQGDEHCSEAAARDYARLRAAELALEQGFTHFEVLRQTSRMKVTRGSINATAGQAYVSAGPSAATGGVTGQMSSTSGSISVRPNWHMPDATLKVRLLREAKSPDPKNEVVAAEETVRSLRVKLRLPPRAAS